MKSYSRIQAEINLDAICSNIEEIKRIVRPETAVMAVIKADGYGHGAIPIAYAVQEKVGGFGVAAIQEALNLRKAGIKKLVLVLGYTPPEYYKELVAADISQTVFRYEMAKRLSEEAGRQGKKARIHMKVDTGMGRIGFAVCPQSIEEISRIAALPAVEIEGIFTHFAGADEADKSSARKQLERFEWFCDSLAAEGIDIPMRHAANSAAIIDLPQANYDMVRAGIAIYGMYPSEEVNKRALALRPALSLRSHVVYVKELEAGQGISYGSTYITTRRTLVATVPVGYADGYPRSLSSKGYVLIQGKRAPVIGRICMDQMMVDVTEIPETKIGDSVTLVGTDGAACITVEEAAALAGTFNYEFVCNLSKRVPRIYYQKGRVIGSMDYTRDELNAVEYLE
ncbi:MAG: alanine racemase [Lachnospiraceae bacterium]|nr:alanine racemase [Lachnospiraceae bacterium]